MRQRKNPASGAMRRDKDARYYRPFAGISDTDFSASAVWFWFRSVTGEVEGG